MDTKVLSTLLYFTYKTIISIRPISFSPDVSIFYLASKGPLLWISLTLEGSL